MADPTVVVVDGGATSACTGWRTDPNEQESVVLLDEQGRRLG